MLLRVGCGSERGGGGIIEEVHSLERKDCKGKEKLNVKRLRVNIRERENYTEAQTFWAKRGVPALILLIWP